MDEQQSEKRRAGDITSLCKIDKERNIMTDNLMFTYSVSSEP